MHKIACLIYLLIICSSCYRSDPWRNLTIKTGSSAFDSSKLIYPATYFLHDVELELLYTAEKLHAYINVYSQRILPYQGDEQAALLSIDTKQGSHQLIVDRLAGGQRLKIPEEFLGTFIQLLKSHSSITLILEEGYKTKINTQGFKKHFATLHNKPLFFIPNNPVGLAL